MFQHFVCKRSDRVLKLVVLFLKLMYCFNHFKEVKFIYTIMYKQLTIKINNFYEKQSSRWWASKKVVEWYFFSK